MTYRKRQRYDGSVNSSACSTTHNDNWMSRYQFSLPSEDAIFVQKVQANAMQYNTIHTYLPISKVNYKNIIMIVIIWKDIILKMRKYEIAVAFFV